MFSKQDIEQLNSLGIDAAHVEQQLKHFANGFPYLNITAPALVGKGITVLDETEQNHMVELYDAFSGSQRKFVPASGAATRMFKQLFEYMDAKGSISLNEKKNGAIKEFFDRIGEFAFYDELKALLNKQAIDIDKLQEKDYPAVVRALLNADGMSYGNLPKAVLKFHKYNDHPRTAIEEHLVEAARYAVGKDKLARLHFTVSEEHRRAIVQLLARVVPLYEQRFNIRFDITLSEQKKSTDTIAVDLNNHAFRNADGSLLFRPGGHGALIENLSELDEDIVFVKNIDNIVPETKVAETVRWKKILAGMLLSYRQQVFSYLNKLEKGERSYPFLQEVSGFMENVFSISIPTTLSEEKLALFLHEKLNRPIRVCGMVKNEGEPGGGPFVIKENDGSTSLQILESSQINMADEHMSACMKGLSHFNPVDLVCSFRTHTGGKFKLQTFVDPQTGFISEKSKDGKPLKAQELPGLWNGAMSRWNTIFVEVPLATFNPVKTVNDLLRKEHLV